MVIKVDAARQRRKLKDCEPNLLRSGLFLPGVVLAISCWASTSWETACASSAGTIYQLVDVSPARMDSLDFALRLLDEARVAVAPGVVFGPGGDGVVRISLAASGDDIEQGLRRIVRSARTWGGDG